MFSIASLDRSTNESQPLLDDHTHTHDESHQPDSHDRPLIWVDLPRHAYEVTRGALPGPTYLLLVLVPIGIVVGALHLNSIATSVLNFFAIIPLSALVSHLSDLLSKRVGHRVGNLINATFGNAVELIVCHPFVQTLDHCADIDVQVGCLALSRGNVNFAQTMMIGSVLSDTLLVSFPSHILIPRC